MTTWQLLTTAWSWDPSVIIGSAALIVVYLILVRFRMDQKTFLFLGGVLTMFVALESPVEALGDNYLFSAHMLQHLVLILVTPPLLLLGIPAGLIQRALEKSSIRKIEGVLRKPLVAWLLGVVTVWAWHLPALYNAAIASENIHIVEHLFFLVTSTIFWWPLLSPLEDHRIAPLATIPYLFAAAAASSALGIILTFTKPGLYPAYVHPVDEIGALSLVRQVWGITPQSDQQLGGLLMWVPGSLVYLLGILSGLARWYSQPEEEIIPKNIETHPEFVLTSSQTEES